ncbi:hypothetical protein [Streptomyces sp. NPDC051211]|uniref:hypothetical protein n=1 Tax=Streptomyces sp. NPDC051211 TaxID=3154643 RepID=UPI00344FCD51
MDWAYQSAAALAFLAWVLLAVFRVFTMRADNMIEGLTATWAKRIYYRRRMQPDREAFLRRQSEGRPG